MIWPAVLAALVIVAIVVAHAVDIRRQRKIPKRPRTMADELAEYRQVNKTRKVR